MCVCIRNFVLFVFALAYSPSGVFAWGAFAGSAAAQEPHAPFSVLSYNVRHVTEQDTGAFDWSKREKNVLALIRKRDPDIFGVQEASSAPIKSALIEEFNGDYDRFQPPNGSPKTIFFRRGRFVRSEREDVEGYFHYENPYAEGANCFDNAKGRSAGWVWLVDERSGREYLVINMHIAHAGACSKARELAAVKLRDFIESKSPETVIVFGDFNTDASRSSEKTISTVEKKQGGLRLFRTARHSGETTAGTATFNNGWKSTGVGKSRLDYIFVGGPDVDTEKQIVDQSKLGGITPSDHFPVIATVRPGLFAREPLEDDLAGATAVDVAFADVNGDAFADKVAFDPSSEGGKPRVYLNRGDGTFVTEPKLSESGALATSGTQFFYADVDGDVCADELSWNPSADDGALRVALSNCDGTFSASVLEQSDPSVRERTEFHFADINADGCADRMAWDPGAEAGRTRTSLSNCDGTFADSIVNVDDGASTNDVAHVYLADVDGDGASDKLLWDKDVESGKTQVYLSNGDGTFTFHSFHSGGYSGVASSKYYFGDLDGDGYADKIFWRHSFREGHPQIYMGTDNGFYGHPIMGNQGVGESATHRMFLADIDANGSLDLITHDQQTNPGRTLAYLALRDGPPPSVHVPEPSLPDGGSGFADAGSDDGGVGAEHDGALVMEGDGLESSSCRIAEAQSSRTFGAVFAAFALLFLRRRQR